jgi:uncharacterized protein
MKYVWDEEKYFENQIKHGIRFEDAKDVFSDENAIERVDLDSDPEEERFVILGLATIGKIVVVFCERYEDTIRIISARRATRNEQGEYEKRIRF